MGQIPEEGESYEPDIFVRDDKSVLVSGDAPVETLTGIIEGFIVDFDKIDYSTVSGFVLKQTEKYLSLELNLDYKGYVIEIIDVDDKKLIKY